MSMSAIVLARSDTPAGGADGEIHAVGLGGLRLGVGELPNIPNVDLSGLGGVREDMEERRD